MPRTVQPYGVRFDYKVTAADSGGTLAKPHNHTREDEFSLVLAGTVGVRIGDRVLEAAASLVKPRGTPHAMWNTDSAAARVLEILAPYGVKL